MVIVCVLYIIFSRSYTKSPILKLLKLLFGQSNLKFQPDLNVGLTGRKLSKTYTCAVRNKCPVCEYKILSHFKERPKQMKEHCLQIAFTNCFSPILKNIWSKRMCIYLCNNWKNKEYILKSILSPTYRCCVPAARSTYSRPFLSRFRSRTITKLIIRMLCMIR